MLPGNDVVNLEGKQRRGLGQLPVFTPGACPSPDEFNQLLLHRAPSAAALFQADAGPRSDKVHKVADTAVALDFGLLVRRKAPFLALDRKVVHSVAILAVEVELQDGL